MTTKQSVLKAWAVVALAIWALFSAAAANAVLSATGSANTNMLSNTSNNNVAISWNVTPDPGGPGTYSSANASTVGVSPSQVLAGVLNSSNPVVVENFLITGAQVQSWLSNGFTAVTIRRTFTDLGRAISADVRFNLVDNNRVTSARGSSSTSLLSANQANQVVINWQVQSTSDRFSNQAVTVNTAPASILAGTITPPSANFSETLIIPGSQVKAWMDAGLSVVVIRRNFTTTAGQPTGGISADVRFRLATSGLRLTREQSLFEVQRMQLSFANQTSLAVVEPASELQAFLDVNYSGSGVFEGAWQIAEPGSTEGLPVYRTLKLEKRTLSAAQQTRIASPVLSTDRPGKYLLRFCLIDRSETVSGGNDFNCPDTDRVVEAAYQVLTEAQLKPQDIEVSSAREVNKNTELGWSPVATAVVYQLQIFQQFGGQAPVFVTGILLPNNTVKTTLTPLVMDKLVSGKTYQWRINALNSQGQLVGQSSFATFTYTGE